MFRVGGHKVESADGQKAYCLKCKEKVDMENAQEVDMKAKGGKTRKALRGKCPKCGTTVYRFLPKDGS